MNDANMYTRMPQMVKVKVGHTGKPDIFGGETNLLRIHESLQEEGWTRSRIRSNIFFRKIRKHAALA